MRTIQDLFAAHAEARRPKPTTARSFEHALDLWCEWPGPVLLGRIDRVCAVGFVDWLAVRQPPLAPATVHRVYRTMRAVFGFLEERTDDGRNPFRGLRVACPGVVKDWPVLTEPQRVQLLELAPDPVWRAAIALALLGGLRLNELQRFRLADWNRAESSLTVLPEEGPHGRVEGTKQRRRLVPVCRVLADALAALPDQPGPALSLNWTSTYRQLVHIMAHANVHAPAPWQTLRRNAGCRWAAAGFPISDVALWMGHTVEVAQKHYLRATPESFRRATV